jgi:tetratricopeptide (TPR) repeat protein
MVAVKRFRIWLCVAGLMGLAAVAQAQSEVRIWEEPIVLPTYEVAPADPNPRFYEGRIYQGAQGPVYPYPMLDVLTANRADHAWKALYLENEYVRICVLPEIGGRIFEALDKTNNHDFFYRQHVIKPDLIGMLGAWISGGVEWCVFHHHRNTTFMPVDYRLVENPDGSKTIWVGEIERRHRMKWELGISLYPGRSLVEVTVKMFNRTPFPNSILYWANVAVHSTIDYQVIYPPGTQFATFHGKNEFTHWPISHEVFRGMDYTAGVDVSWWKSHPSASSFFAWNPKRGFFGGYDHGKEAGVVHVADKNIVPGMKLWTWGTQSTGDRKKLTDNDGPYAEIMAGAFSDNQPDYSWIRPHEVKTFTQCWYPLRELGGVVEANREAALNVTVNDRRMSVGVNTTAPHTQATLKAQVGDRVVFEEAPFHISPADPHVAEFALPADVTPESVRVSLYDEGGRELIAYQPVTYPVETMPEPVKPPPPPAEIATVEELYLTGLRLQQIHNPVIDPLPYYEEALKRDPGESRALTILAIEDCRKGLFVQAEERLRKAIERTTKDYTRPREGEAHFYLGVALDAQGRFEEAYDAYYRAAWSAAWTGPAYYSLAELRCRAADFEQALEHIERSLQTNMLDTQALDLRCAILRKQGRTEDAAHAADQVMSIDPLNAWAQEERILLAPPDSEQRAARLAELRKLMRGDPNDCLEIAMDYARSAQYEEAVEVLKQLVEAGTDAPGRTYPLLYYHLGYYTDLLGDPTQAAQWFQQAEQQPSTYCFPYALDTIPVLRRALEVNPGGAHAAYYLGNLLYDLQPDAALEAWEKSYSINPDFAPNLRNLGYACGRKGEDLHKAAEFYEAAVRLDPEDPRLFYELDALYERLGEAPDKRLALLEQNSDTVMRRDDILSRKLSLQVQMAHYDDAIAVLESHGFTTWEGAGGIHTVFVDAHILRGMQRLNAKDKDHALEDFNAGLTYPPNLGVDPPLSDPQAARAQYLIGLAYSAKGDAATAKQHFKTAADTEVGGSEFRYHKGLAMQGVGRAEEAKALFDALIADGNREIESGGTVDFFAKFGERESKAVQVAQAHYLVALGRIGLGEIAGGIEELNAALKINPNHLWAQAELTRLKSKP